MPQVRKAAYAVHLLQNLTSSQKDNLQNTATVVLNTGNKRVGGDLSRNLLFLHKSQFSESLPSRVFFFFFFRFNLYYLEVLRTKILQIFILDLSAVHSHFELEFFQYYMINT